MHVLFFMANYLQQYNFTGVSVRTISRIRKESSESEGSSLSTPRKSRPRPKLNVDDFDRRVIRDTIADFYLYEKRVPTGPSLLAAIREKIPFPWKVGTLYKLLHDMGFKWKRCATKRKVLIERPAIVAWRAKYLRAVKHYRSQNKVFVYLDETWIDNNLTFKKCWQREDVQSKVFNNYLEFYKIPSKLTL